MEDVWLRKCKREGPGLVNFRKMGKIKAFASIFFLRSTPNKSWGVQSMNKIDDREPLGNTNSSFLWSSLEMFRFLQDYLFQEIMRSQFVRVWATRYIFILQNSYSQYIEDVTWWQEDMNFMFEWKERKIPIFELMCNVPLLHKHTDDGFLMIFWRFLTTFRRFSKIVPKARWTFPNIFRSCLKISKDCLRLSRNTWRCFDDTPTNLTTI